MNPPERQCRDKIRYRARRQAARTLRILQERSRTHKRTVVYRCDFCGGYHLGREPQVERRWTDEELHDIGFAIGYFSKRGFR